MKTTNSNNTLKQLDWFCKRIGNEITSIDFPKQKFKVKNLAHAEKIYEMQKKYNVIYKDLDKGYEY